MTPSEIQKTFDLALQHHQAGRLYEAQQLYARILAQQPNHADAMHLLGVIAHEVGREKIAVTLIRGAIALNPNLPEAFSNLGNALKDGGRIDEAIAAHRQAIALNPNLPGAHNNLGIALAAQGATDDALAAFRRAIALDPNYPEGHNNLGNSLREKGQLDEAVAAFRRAAEIRPDYAAALSNLANTLKDSGLLDEAIAVYDRAIALNPGSPNPHYSLSLALLARGDFQRGWEEYEWRWKCDVSSFPPRNFAQPGWDGSPLQDQTLLLYAEQGFGDAIQFLRFVPLAAKRAKKIVIECQTRLQRLFQANIANCQVVSAGQPLPSFDFHAPFLSLPRILRTASRDVPNAVPYLHADKQNIAYWHRRVEEADYSQPTGSLHLKIGIAWAGRPTHKNDRNRSIDLAQLIPLAKIAGVRFFSLQKGDAAEQIKTRIRNSAEMDLVDWTAELNDFADTAALIANLDLVIAVDTAVAHLAGAMGKPVWVLLPSIPDWRWMLDRQDSPWYPSMRLFRKKNLGDWETVIANVADALSRWMDRH
jgi:tetratricopeptide (TPR) repeat protein